MSAPWFKVYSKELLSDPKVKLLTHEQLGMLLLLWAYANEDGCFIPSDPNQLAKLLGGVTGKQMVKHLVWILRFFAPVEGDPSRLQSFRLLAEQNAYAEKCQKLRENGTKGGRPPKPKAKPDGLPDGEPFEEPFGKPNKTEEGRRKKEKELPPTPLPAATGSAPKGAPRRRRSRAEVLVAFPQQVQEVVNPLVEAWHGEDPEDGRKITVDLALFGGRVQEILTAHPEVSGETLLQAAQAYLASKRNRYKAPQYFFGPEGPWKSWVQFVLTQVEVPHAS